MTTSNIIGDSLKESKDIQALTPYERIEDEGKLGIVKCIHMY